MEEMHTYIMQLSGIKVPCSFRFKGTEEFFSDYMINQSCVPGICVSEYEWKKWVEDGGVLNAHGEYSNFTACTSDYLMKYERLILHGVCFSHKGKAWIICADPGVGKSTQIKTLSELYPGEFSVICGDRPVVEVPENGEIIAHPSPWNGKEGWHGAKEAPLAGIICLERGPKTVITQYSRIDAVIPVLKSVITTFKDREIIHSIAVLEDRLLRSIPVWKYVNGGIPKSSKLLYENVLQ